MCPIGKSKRKEIMKNGVFERILQRLLPIRENINILTLLGLGETLMDTKIIDKIRIAKRYKFSEVGIFSNGMNLTERTALRLLYAGLDSIVLSIDGFKKETEESIRIGSNFERIVENIDSFIEIRKALNAKTKIIIRFTKQEKNKDEWLNFLEFWSGKLSKDHGDAIFSYNIHNAGDETIKNESSRNIPTENLKCPEVFNRMIIFSDGSIGLCCGDQFGHYDIGNILESDPIELYNHKLFQHYREEMIQGNISNLELCKSCTVAHSIATSTHIFL